jgi:YbbR domain-containing protein
MIKKLLFHNFWAKVSALLLAVLIWFYVSGEENVEVTKVIPVKYMLHENCVVTDTSAGAVRITLKGPNEIIKSADFHKMFVAKNLTGVTEGGNVTFQVTGSQIMVPKYTTITSISPAEITVTVDRLTEKELAVQASLRDRPSPGYVVEKVELNPSIVKVRAPESFLSKASTINTRSIDLTGRTKSFTHKIDIDPILGKYGTAEPVEITITIKEQSAEKLFEKTPVGILHSPAQNYAFKLTPPAVNVTVRGPTETVSKTEVKNIKCYVDVADLKPGEYELPIQTSMPKEIAVLKLDPATVKVSIKEEGFAIQTQTTIETPKDIKKEGL